MNKVHVAWVERGFHAKGWPNPNAETTELHGFWALTVLQSINWWMLGTCDCGSTWIFALHISGSRRNEYNLGTGHNFVMQSCLNHPVMKVNLGTHLQQAGDMTNII